MKKSPRLAKPVMVDLDDEMVWIILRNGRALGTPTALYSRLATAAPQELASVEFQRDRIYWPRLGKTIQLEEVALASTTLEWGDWWMRFKRRVIILLESLEGVILHHRFIKICDFLTCSSWWGEQWATKTLDSTQR